MKIAKTWLWVWKLFTGECAGQMVNQSRTCKGQSCIEVPGAKTLCGPDTLMKPRWSLYPSHPYYSKSEVFLNGPLHHQLKFHKFLVEWQKRSRAFKLLLPLVNFHKFNRQIRNYWFHPVLSIPATVESQVWLLSLMKSGLCGCILSPDQLPILIQSLRSID